MVWLLIIVHLVLIGWLAKKVARTQEDKLFWPALVWKCLAGIALGSLYFHHYGYGDTVTYFLDAANVLRQGPSYTFDFMLNGPKLEGEWNGAERSVYMVKWLLLPMAVTGNNYWISSIYFSILSFLSAWYLYLTVVRKFPDTRLAAAIAFLLYPSIVFWSSGVIKESLASAALMVSAAVVFRIYYHIRIRAWEWLAAGVAIWILWSLKYYWAAALVAVWIPTWLVRGVLPNLSVVRSLLVWAILLLIIGVATTTLHPNFHLDRLAAVVYENNLAFMKLSKPPVIHFDSLAPVGTSLLLNAPWALWSGVFRPGIWEASGPIGWIAALENTLLLLMLIAAFVRYRTWHIGQDSVLLITSILVYCAALTIFLTLSTPNLGTLSRYRVGYLPWIVFLTCLGNTWMQQFEKRIASLS